MGVTPMFPLDTVLLPGAMLPLQIFEPRYRTMIIDLLADDNQVPAFGVVLIERGHEVGGGDERCNVGTLAQALDIRATAEGRYLLVAVGTERIRVNRWLPDDPYPVAEIEPWRDPEPPSPGEAAQVAPLLARVDALNVALRELGETTPPSGVVVSDDPHLALYHLAALAPIGEADRQAVLAAPTFASRLLEMKSALEDVDATVKFRRS